MGGVSLVGQAQTPADLGARVQYYLKYHGPSDPREPGVARAGRIFEQLHQVAEKPAACRPRLQVIDTSGSPWAIALPDCYIVLSRGALAIAYRDATEAEGDARLAFLLGHELAHLTKGDYSHQEVYRALAGDSSPAAARLRELFEASTDVLGSEVESSRKVTLMKETEADERGFVYAAVAGFAVDGLLGQPAAGKPDFFQHWMTQTQTRLDRQHPAPEDRAHLLRMRLRKLGEKLELFHYGVRLAHFGRYDDAEYFLREFQQVFPAREVFGNLGYLYLEKAREAISASWAYHYCLPAVLDSRTRAVALVSRGVDNSLLIGAAAGAAAVSPQAREWLNDAVGYLKRAVEADAAYLPGWLNLAVAYFYLGEMHEARAVIEKALQQAPSDLEAQYLRALILYRQGPTPDMWPTALKILEDLAAQPEAPACVTYNLARILEERGREGKAREVWASLVPRAAALSSPYRRVVCQHADDEAACQAGAAAKQDQALAWSLPVSPGQTLPKLDAANDPLAGWTRFGFNWRQSGLDGSIHIGPNGASVLELDGVVEMVVSRPAKPEPVGVLAACCGSPTTKRMIAGGEVWSFGPRRAVLVRDGQVQEVWAIH
jgi:predicted Zn-dependent protease